MATIQVYLSLGMMTIEIADADKVSALKSEIAHIMTFGGVVEGTDDDDDNFLIKGEHIAGVSIIFDEDEAAAEPGPKPAMANVYDVTFKGKIVARGIPGVDKNDAILAFIQKAGHPDLQIASAAMGGGSEDFDAIEDDAPF